MGKPDPNVKIKAFIVMQDNKKLKDLKDLKKYCLEEMEPYKIPHEFEIVEELPKTSTGKVKRHLLLIINSLNDS